MTTPADPDPLEDPEVAEVPDAAARRARARRRKKIDEIFGDTLPSTTDDERDPSQRGGFSAEHYRASKPPHWGVKQ